MTSRPQGGRRYLPVAFTEYGALIHAVESKSVARVVKRNALRFPPEFVFILQPEEAAALRC